MLCVANMTSNQYNIETNDSVHVYATQRVIAMDSPVDPKEASESVTGNLHALNLRCERGCNRFFIMYITCLELNHDKYVH